MSDEQLYNLVSGSTLTFTGTVIEMAQSNVSGIDPEDSMIVQVEKVESPTDQQVLKKFGDLKGAKLTVTVNAISRIWMQKDLSAVFFAEPLIYEKNIGVIATPLCKSLIARKNL